MFEKKILHMHKKVTIVIGYEQLIALSFFIQKKKTNIDFSMGKCP